MAYRYAKLKKNWDCIFNKITISIIKCQSHEWGAWTIRKSGDTINVYIKIREGNKERVQPYEGVVIAKRHGGINETITVRRIFQGIGVERVFMLHSPQVASLKVERRGKVRRAKLFYLRDRVGKATRVKQRFDR